MSEEETKSEEFVKVEGLTPRSREVNIIVKIVSKGETRSVSAGTHEVSDVVVGDETGSIIMTLWDDAIKEVEAEDTLKITNGYVNLFKGSMRLNIGKYGNSELLEESPIEEVNSENNLSDKQYEQERRDDRRGSYRRSYGRSDRSRYGGRDSRRRY